MKKINSKSEERLDLCLSAGNLAWWEMNVKTGKVIFNENKVKMLGYTMNDFKDADYKTFMNLLHPDDHDRVMQDMKEHLNGKNKAYEVEYRIKSKNGIYKWYYDKGSVVERDKNNNPLVVKGIVIDITRLKQSEILENLSNKILNLLNEPGKQVVQIKNILLFIKNSCDFEAVGIRIKDRDNFPYYETNGFPENFIKKTNNICEDSLNNKSKTQVYDCICGKIITGNIDPKLPFFTKNGSFWTNDFPKFFEKNKKNISKSLFGKNCIKAGFNSIAIIPIRTKDKIAGLIQINDKRKNIFSEDIIRTLESIGCSIGIAFARDKAIKEIKINERRFRLAQKAADIGSWDWDISTGDLKWSEKIEPMFGFKEGKFKGTYEAFLDSVHPDDRDFVEKSVNDSLNLKKKYQIEHRIVWPDGIVKWVLERGDVIRDKNDKPKRMLGIVQDITYKKEIEDELKERKDQLEKTVEERTQELVEANKKLKEEIYERKRAEIYIERTKENLRNVIDSASELIISFDMNNRVSTWNKTAEIITGYKQIEVLNRSVGKLDVFSNTENIIEKIKLVCGKKAPGYFDLILITKDYDNRIIRVNGTEIKSQNNECIGTLFIGKDITRDIDLHKRLLGGNSYLITDRNNKSSIDLLIDLTIDEYKGLIIIRGNPDQIKKQIPQSKNIEIMFLTREEIKGFNNILNFEKLINEFKQFTNKNTKSVILLDGVHYLISRFSFDEFIKYLYDINDIIAKNKAILFVRIDPSIIDNNQMALIENELLILPSQKTEDIIIQDDVYDILKYINQQNLDNAVVSVKKIMAKFNITYVTAASRIKSLETKGLIFSKKQGKFRAIFVAEKGKKLLHKRTLA